MKTVWVYINTAREVGDVDHLKVFATVEAADEWFTEHDPEGVAFEYPVTGVKDNGMRPRPTPLKNISVTIDGITHDGTYYVQSSMVCVQSQLGTKATQVGGSRPEMIARLLLSELVRESTKP
jgi:hypothetical protein